MQIDTLLLRGQIHEVYGEDALFYSELGDDWYIAAVLDGCSSGTESHFASALMVKSLKKSVKSIPLMSEINPELKLDSFTPHSLGEYILGQLFEDLKRVRRILLTDKYELLSTLFLLVYHQPSKKIFIGASGDGIIKINDEVIEIDQNNMPDYMAYHFNLSFDELIKNHLKTITRENVESVILSTDGIQKFFDKNKKLSKNINPVELFLREDKKSLNQKYELLCSKYKLFPFDDVSIIRLKF